MNFSHSECEICLARFMIKSKSRLQKRKIRKKYKERKFKSYFRFHLYFKIQIYVYIRVQCRPISREGEGKRARIISKSQISMRIANFECNFYIQMRKNASASDSIFFGLKTHRIRIAFGYMECTQLKYIRAIDILFRIRIAFVSHSDTWNANILRCECEKRQ